MLVLVMAEVFCRLACLMTAIARRCRPGELDGQDQQKDEKKQSAHRSLF